VAAGAYMRSEAGFASKPRATRSCSKLYALSKGQGPCQVTRTAGWGCPTPRRSLPGVVREWGLPWTGIRRGG
jgi:hypothetical protein